MKTTTPHRLTRGSALPSLPLSIAILVLGTAGWWWSDRGDDAVAVDPDLVVTVERKDLIDGVTASGRVDPLARVAVMSRASGILKEIHVEEGDVVKFEQALAELDREQLMAQLAQDEAGFVSAEARLAAGKARLAEARVRLDDPEHKFARREFDRLEKLAASGDVSTKERDEAEKALGLVDHRIRLVEASLPILEAAVAETEANLLSAEAAVDRSRTALNEATVRSPIDGVVLFREKEVGDGVSSLLTAGGNATQIMILGDLSEMFIKARVDEVDLGRIYPGMEAQVTVDAHRGMIFSGAIDRIAPAGSVDNSGIVTFEVRIALADPESLLRPDMTADAKLILGRRDQVTVLPQRALTRGERGQWMVRRVIGEGAEARTETVPVTLGLSDGLITEVQGDLEEGDKVLLPASPDSQSWRR